MAKFGLPYMGSKSSIAEKLITLLPKATHFYDLFGGGFSITHAMIVRRPNDYEHFHFNEIRPGICGLIQDAIAGKYSYDNFLPEWISRERFHSEKEKNAYIKICWSFGNNGRSYIFGQDIESYKKSMHQAIVFNEFDELAKSVLAMDKFRDGFSIYDRRMFLLSKVEEYRKTTIPKVLHKFLNEKRVERLEQLQRLQKLQKLHRLERLQQLTLSSKSYDDIYIEDNAIIYCDPPYAGTAEYDGNTKFNHKTFLDWADAQNNPVFISEYDVKDSRFRRLFTISKRSLFGGSKKDELENVFGNKAAVKKVWESARENHIKKTKKPDTNALV